MSPMKYKILGVLAIELLIVTIVWTLQVHELATPSQVTTY